MRLSFESMVSSEGSPTTSYKRSRKKKGRWETWELSACQTQFESSDRKNCTGAEASRKLFRRYSPDNLFDGSTRMTGS